MTHAAWLRSRTPPAPPAIIERIEVLLASRAENDGTPVADAFVEAAEVLLRRVLAGDPAARGGAMDLLAADACVTYAFEAAADEPATIDRRARDAEDRIARIADAFRPKSAAAEARPAS